MNIEIKVDGLEVKVYNTSKEHVNNLVLAAIQLIKGKEFREHRLEVDGKEILPDNLFQLNPIEKDKNKIKAVNGIKVLPDGTETYKCLYKCRCNHRGIRYIKDMDSPVYCHKCNAVLKAQPSTLNDAHDAYENYFLAE